MGGGPETEEAQPFELSEWESPDHDLHGQGTAQAPSLASIYPVLSSGAAEISTRGKTTLASMPPQPTTVETPLVGASSSYQQPSAFQPHQPPAAHAFDEAAREVRWNVLERFSRITRMTRYTAHNILEAPVTRELIPLLPYPLLHLLENSYIQTTINDYDSAHIYLSQLSMEDEAQRSGYRIHDGLGGSGYDDLSESLWSRGRNMGIWGRDGYEAQTALGAFDIIESDAEEIPYPERANPLSAEVWTTFFNDYDGHLLVPVGTVRKAIFQGGVDPDLRIEVWKWLLGMYTWDSTADEREAIRRSKRDEYFALKAEWFSSPDKQSDAKFLEERSRISKDVHRTDRSQPCFAGEDMPNPDVSERLYETTNQGLEDMKDVLVTFNVWNTDLGYVQGMSDLLAPIYAVMGDEAMAFWCFAGFMERVQSNFYRDQSGMHRQLSLLKDLLAFMDPLLYSHFANHDSLNLFFCFRWLLVWFKREFNWDDTMRLWEVMWTDYECSWWIGFVCLAVLDREREMIMNELTEFDDILKHINELALKIDLDSTLARAEYLHKSFCRRVETIDRRKQELQKQLEERVIWTNPTRRADIQEEINRLP
ncbi:hypothetical protein BZG36_04639, partial [Bifiguratus adelaidae]